MNSRRRGQILIWPSRASQWIKPETAGQPASGRPGADRGSPARRPRGGPRSPQARPDDRPGPFLYAAPATCGVFNIWLSMARSRIGRTGLCSR